MRLLTKREVRNDPSFFYRVRGPAGAALGVMSLYLFAGAGLTGEPFVETEVTNLYVRLSGYSAGWRAQDQDQHER